MTRLTFSTPVSFGLQPPSDSWGAIAQRFRLDPRRDLDANLQEIASYLRPDDVFVDVGGGAGRVSLPLAQSCREVVVVEPSPGMGAEFDASRRDAGIGNASRVQAEWMDAGSIEGDVVFAGCVTYFVRDIVPFVEKLQASARRRVMITLWSEPPACSAGPLFDLVYGEPQGAFARLSPAHVGAVGDGYPAQSARVTGCPLVGECKPRQP